MQTLVPFLAWPFSLWMIHVSVHLMSNLIYSQTNIICCSLIVTILCVMLKLYHEGLKLQGLPYS